MENRNRKKEIELHQNFIRRYGKLGEILFKCIEYIPHPKKLVKKVREKLKEGR